MTSGRLGHRRSWEAGDTWSRAGNNSDRRARRQRRRRCCSSRCQGTDCTVRPLTNSRRRPAVQRVSEKMSPI